MGTLVLIATDGFKRYQTATGAILDTTVTGLLHITAAQLSKLQSLFFIINGVCCPTCLRIPVMCLFTPLLKETFEFTANAQLWPRSLNADLGGIASMIYLIVNDIGTPSGEGLDFVNGFTFLERFYTVLDTGNKRVGLATTPFTNATTN